ncbi:hypothetical protein NEOLEDRAFT_1179332 [Neolentinus lepideus HHB14362 ss-1]|uniref:Zn(2)-C6 fungal-type domain-containing protein n=1 Tax=Neolentinus lepideus HHB14362 ss-1 TaxID=1314782 RepID=A0A165RVY0_9AGAM|nr:hypothetical protein NEOLEDRAFT_1179332 [Neolentinus lepideus HHB14362 ss-1]
MFCEFIDPSPFAMEPKDYLPAYPPTASSPENALGIDNTYHPQELSLYLQAQQPYGVDQFYYSHDYLSPLNMAPAPHPQYDVPQSPRGGQPYQPQLPPPDSHWAALDPNFTFPGPSTDIRGGSLPNEQPVYPQQAFDSYVSHQPIQPQPSGSAPPAGIPHEQWAMAGSLDPNNNMFYRSAEHPRLRTAQACEKCRARKAKCSGEHPTCARCVSRGLICEYASERRMRGPNKRKNKPPLPPLSTSSGSPTSSPSSRRSSVVSLPDVKPEIDVIPAVVRRQNSPPPPSRPASSGGQRKLKARPPPLNLGAESNYGQRRIQAALLQNPNPNPGWLGAEQMTVRPRADVPRDVGSAASRASFASDVSMDDEAVHRDMLSRARAYPLSSVRDRAGSLDVPHSASPLSSQFLVHGHGRSMSSGATDVTPIFLQPHNVQQRFSVPFHQGLPSPQLQYPVGVQWTSDAPFGIQQ